MPRKNLSEKRIGEERYNKNGCLMKIVEYNRTTDIIVEFQDEHKERVHTNYYHFIRGEVENPRNKMVKNKHTRLGEERYSNNNELMKIVEYNNSKDIVVEFQDKNKHRVRTTYNHFLQGEVKNRGKHVGETNINCQGETMTIIEYNNNINVIVKFSKTGSIKTCRYDSFKNGQVKDNYFKDIYGVACVGNAVTIDKNKKKKKSYETWFDMIMRCYDNHPRKNETYSDCYVCDEWLCFENFEKWFNENYYEIPNERIQLDKDIIKKNNRIYCPEFCIFAPQRINILVMRKKNDRGKYPIGITKVKKYNKFRATTNNINEHITTFHDTPEEAFYAYKERKEMLIKQIADEYKSVIPKKLYDALYAYEVEITD